MSSVATSASGLTFSTNIMTAGQMPLTVAAADFNGDGRLDLVCGNYISDTGITGGNTLTVFTNTGAGGFLYSATLTMTNYGIGSVQAADLNNDGFVDIVTINAGTVNVGTNKLTIFTNNGQGVFGLNAVLTVNTNPAFVCVADVNGDGAPDLLSADFGQYGTYGNTITILTNDGHGVFSHSATLIVGFNPSGIAVADLDGDGKVDLTCANFYDSTVTVLTNNGQGVFGLHATLPTGNNPRRVIAADVNGDAKPDLITADFLGRTLTILTNDGAGGFALSAKLGTLGTAHDVVAIDMDGDGTVDLACVSGNPGGVNVFTNNGHGVFGLNTTIGGDSQSGIVAADVNADGRPDLIMSDYGFGSPVLTLNGVVVLINTSPFPAANSTPSLVLNAHGAGLMVSWPSAAPGWMLQEKPDLRGASWLPSGYGGFPIRDEGTNKTLTLPHLNGSGYFRLIHP